jgi:GAF domain-containing protein
MAVPNSASRDELARIADEQAALRRVATLVAKRVPTGELFAAVVQEAGRLMVAHTAGLLRYDAPDMVNVIANWTAEDVQAAVGGRWPLEGDSIAPRVQRSGRPERIDDWSTVEGPLAAFIRDELGIVSAVGTPVVVEERLWGTLMVQSKTGTLAPDTESRLAALADLVATAIANERAQDELRRFADEQAALRRVATLVAQRSPAEKVFAAVAEEVGRLLRIPDVLVLRYESDGTATLMADSRGAAGSIAVGERVSLDGASVTAQVRRTKWPARVEYAQASGSLAADARSRGMRSGVGAPVLVDGRLWGAIVAGSPDAEPLPAGTESKLAEFAALVAAAIS